LGSRPSAPMASDTAVFTGPDGGAHATVEKACAPGHVAYLNKLATTLIHDGHCTVVARDRGRVGGREMKLQSDARQLHAVRLRMPEDHRRAPAGAH
jgi:hypothetical protein